MATSENRCEELPSRLCECRGLRDLYTAYFFLREPVLASGPCLVTPCACAPLFIGKPRTCTNLRYFAPIPVTPFQSLHIATPATPIQLPSTLILTVLSCYRAWPHTAYDINAFSLPRIHHSTQKTHAFEALSMPLVPRQFAMCSSKTDIKRSYEKKKRLPTPASHQPIFQRPTKFRRSCSSLARLLFC